MPLSANPPPGDVCVSLTDATIGYGARAAVHHLSGQVRRGELTAVVGANGSGKSTLIKCIAGLMRPISGDCRLSHLATAYMPQQSELDRSFPAQVRDVVALGLWQSRGLLGRHRQADCDRIARALQAIGLGGFETRSIDSLSGGQMRRALFARVLVQDAALILLDEPFNAIDEQTIGDLLALIHRWQAEGRTVIAVLHDLDLVRAHFPRSLLLARHSIAWGPTATVLTPENLRRARRFRQNWEKDAAWCLEPSEQVA
ncbi:zinc ABC transporter ATP-binding protein AztA [Paracoccus sp. NGMCC 1.201697]|uniref:Zinc ABC transporter ATP-binding protein AztA n=1 Tax=Paracoccus broussonetiae subsp. drimophilus TaxID=3373869 RepID=A0ABW7LJZ6_9RHOB